MERALTLALFNGELTTERGSHCAVGTVLHDVLGFRVGKESWMPILASHRFGTTLPEGLIELKNMITNHISLDTLCTIDHAYHIDIDVSDRVDRVLRATKQQEQNVLLEVY